MTRDDIIRMAREAGCEIRNGHIYHQFSLDQMLKRFDALVRADERKACAELCEQWDASHPEALAAAIRARGNHGQA